MNAKDIIDNKTSFKHTDYNSGCVVTNIKYPIDHKTPYIIVAAVSPMETLT